MSQNPTPTPMHDELVANHIIGLAVSLNHNEFTLLVHEWKAMERELSSQQSEIESLHASLADLDAGAKLREERFKLLDAARNHLATTLAALESENTKVIHRFDELIENLKELLALVDNSSGIGEILSRTIRQILLQHRKDGSKNSPAVAMPTPRKD